MDELKPCPFCGGTEIFVEPDETGSGGQWVTPIHVGCKKCQCEQMADDMDEAITAWNTRPREDAGVVDEAMAERALKALIQEEVEQFGYASTPYNGARTACMKAALAAALGRA